VEEQPFRRRTVGIDVVVHRVELLLSDPRELDADADGHAASLSVGLQPYAVERFAIIEVAAPQ
jgi:hypothetical protein